MEKWRIMPFSCHFHAIFHALKILFASSPPNIWEFKNPKYKFTNKCTEEFYQMDSKMERKRISWKKFILFPRNCQISCYFHAFMLPSVKIMLFHVFHASRHPAEVVSPTHSRISVRQKRHDLLRQIKGQNSIYGNITNLRSLMSIRVFVLRNTTLKENHCQESLPMGQWNLRSTEWIGSLRC